MLTLILCKKIHQNERKTKVDNVNRACFNRKVNFSEHGKSIIKKEDIWNKLRF